MFDALNLTLFAEYDLLTAPLCCALNHKEMIMKTKYSLHFYSSVASNLLQLLQTSETMIRNVYGDCL